MTFDLIPALRPKDRRSTICVQVSRKWEFRGAEDDGPIQHVNLILVDEKGNAIYAKIPPSHIERHNHLLQIGGTYVIDHFKISNAKTNFRPVENQYMIEFTFHTRITVATNPPTTFPQIICNPISFSQVLSFLGEKKNLLDVIGIITEVAEPSWVHLSSQPNPTLQRNIILKDLNELELKVTLWGQRATQFSIDNIYDPNESKPIIALFVGGLIKSYQGECYYSGNSACHWYLNPDIPEAQIFYSTYKKRMLYYTKVYSVYHKFTYVDSYRLQNNHIEIKRTGVPLQNLMPPQTTNQLEFKYLHEMQAIDTYDFPEHGFKCTVTISRLVPDASWWYPTCKFCNRSCKPDPSGYFCYECNTTQYVFKYKICFFATDGTAEAEMICFGEVARRIVGKPVEALIRSTRRGEHIPPDLTAIVSQRFTFGIILTDQSYDNEDKSYQVISIIASHGRQQNIPRPAAPTGPSTSRLHSSQDTPSPSKTLNLQQINFQTPPPLLHITETSDNESQTREDANILTESDLKRSLFQDTENDNQDDNKEKLTRDPRPIKITRTKRDPSEEAAQKTSSKSPRTQKAK